MRHRGPQDSVLPQLARDQLLGELRRLRLALIEAQQKLRRGSPLARALDALFIDIDDIAFLMTGDRDHFTRARAESAHWGPDPAYRQGRHEQTHLDGYAGLDKQTGIAPEDNGDS